MSKKDKYRFVPWFAVVICGFALAILGRYIAIKQGVDNGTANLIFILVFAGFILAYLLFMALWEPLFHKFIGKKLTPKPRPEDMFDDLAQTELLISEELPELSQAEVPVKEEESVPVPMPSTSKETPKLDWKELHEKEIQSKLSLFLEYSRLTMGPYVSEAELTRLDEYIELFAREMALPDNVAPIKPEKLKNPDLYHFGWNMQYYFQVGKREDVVPWLQTVFSELKELSPSTIKGKLHDYQTKKHIIPNIDDIPKYMAEKKV